MRLLALPSVAPVPGRKLPRVAGTIVTAGMVTGPHPGLRPAAAILVLSGLRSAAVAEPHAVTGLLPFIRAIEAPRGYGDYERRIRIPPPRPLTDMSLADVLAWQDRVRRAGAPSTAAGGYQIIRPTLRRLMDSHGLDPDARFDRKMQDRLARLLIAECGPQGPPASLPAYGNCLAGIWASLPLTDGPDRGRSAYHGMNGNRALTTPETVLSLLAGDSVQVTPGAGAGGRPRITDGVALAFGAVRVSRSRISAAMRDAARAGTLTRSARRWSFDPYAVD